MLNGKKSQIIEAIYDNDGVLTRRHIKEEFYHNMTWRAMEKMLASLKEKGYIDWASLEQRRNNPIPEPVVWLHWKGALHIASLYGVKISPPKRINENQLRQFQKALRDNGIRWLREPHWHALRHDIAVTDFKVAVNKSVSRTSSYTLARWIPESIFRKEMRERKMQKGVCPDGYFEILDEDRRIRGEPFKAPFLLEMDMGTRDNPSFGRKKVLPGIAYVNSQDYKRRLGNDTGIWLIVTGGKKLRMENLMDQTKEKAGNNVHIFFFTMLSSLENADPLFSRIWKQVGDDFPVALFPR